MTMQGHILQLIVISMKIERNAHNGHIHPTLRRVTFSYWDILNPN